MKKSKKYLAVSALTVLLAQNGASLVAPFHTNAVYAAASFSAVTTGHITVVTGSGIAPNEVVEIMDEYGSESYGKATTDANGRFTITLTKAISGGETISAWVGIQRGVPVTVTGDKVTDNSSSTGGGSGSTQPTPSKALILTRYNPNERYVLATGSTVGIVVQVETLKGEVLGSTTITDTSHIEVTLNRALKYDEILKIKEVTHSGLLQNEGYVVTDSLGTVTVNYVDTQGNTIATTEVLQGQVGEDGSTVSPSDTRHYYVTEKKTIENYQFVRVDGAATEGKYVKGNLIVTYVYEPTKKITTSFVDEDGNELLPKVEGDEKALAINGYSFKETQVDAEGNIKHIYKQDTTAGSITVTHVYVDDKGNVEVTDYEVLKGEIGEAWTTARKDRDGFTKVTLPNNPTGVFTDTAQTVTYVYVKEAKSEMIGNVRVLHFYINANGKVEKVEEPLLTGRVGSNYTTAQKDKEGYTLFAVPSNANGTFLSESQAIVYTYIQKGVDPITPNGLKSSSKTNNSMTKGNKLPQTGTQSAIWATIIGLGVLIVSSAIAMIKRRTNK